MRDSDVDTTAPMSAVPNQPTPLPLRYEALDVARQARIAADEARVIAMHARDDVRRLEESVSKLADSLDSLRSETREQTTTLVALREAELVRATREQQRDRTLAELDVKNARQFDSVRGSIVAAVSILGLVLSAVVAFTTLRSSSQHQPPQVIYVTPAASH